MATTLYFALNTASAKEPGTYPVAATNYANVTPTASVTTEGFMIPYKWREVANLTMGTGTGTTAKISRFGRFFSAPFAEDYTYNHPTTSGDAIKYFLADWEDNLDANHCIQQCYVFVWRSSTGAVVGVIQPVQTLAPGAKEPSAASSIQSTLGSYFSGTPGSISILKGDILVFEPFSTYTKGATTARNVRFYYGGATDITAENTVVATPASKVVFSVDLPLEMPIGAVTGSLKYKAVVELRGPRFVSDLRSRARLLSAKLVDGSPFISRLKAHATANAALTTQTLLSADLKSISKITAWRQQTHDLSVTLYSRARAFATFPDRAIGEALNLYYSGTGTADNPTLSIGGKKGPPLAGQDFVASPSAPGVQVLAVQNMADGSYLLRVDAVRKQVSLVLVDDIHKYTAAIGPGVSTVAVGSKEAGFVIVRLDSAAITSVDIGIDVTFRLNTLFLNPSATALLEGETVYRCLYVFNDTSQEVTNVTLSVATDSLDEVGIASEYTTDVTLQGFNASQKPRSIHHKALDPTGWGGAFFYESTPQVYSEFAINSLPAVITTAVEGQATDGDTIQVPMRIEEEHDPNGRMAGLTFGPTLAWARIPPRRGVSFWVRKHTTPASAGENTFKALFTVTADF